ncbi:hypothetical protein [Candidatus Magnetominusculus xianensis]|uniref:Uncharacterized protein n=1 Tax=Candidatus Magnetominusculus xianensis TaxID=1748249 RepID=A0ABR5SBF0_9BACT|nr:hypothetical protein [Candidatus Magnetominusculus xianensis]KWT77349.1 hypothetical protein ASN18_3044 [Candidatus Magnetominusculus xianensis]MBF0404968.1 hypothetical protein [Nitrospirota bacterium]
MGKEALKDELDVIEFHDPIRRANISIVVKKEDGIDMVQAISFCVKGSPFPLAEIFRIEEKTFISLPRGFQGVPLTRPVMNMFVPDEERKPTSGCSGCGKDDSNGVFEVDLEVK